MHERERSGVRAEVLEGAEGFARCEDDWRRLHAALDRPAYHLVYGVVRSSVACLEPKPQDLIVVRVVDGGECVALLRLVPHARRILRVVRLRSLEVSRFPECPNQDVLMHPRADAAAVWRAVVDALRTHGVRWDAISALAVPLGQGLHRLAAALPARSRVVAGVGASASENVFDTRRPHAELAARFSALLAKNLGKGRRRIERTGAWDVVSVRGAPASLWAFDEFCRVEASGWKGTQGIASAALLTPRTLAYFRSVFLIDEAPACHGEVNLLRLDVHAIAAQLCVVSGRTRYVVKIGFDERHGRLGPGQLLIDEMLRRSCADAGIDAMSLVSNQPWHDDWCPDRLPVDDVMILRNATSVRAWHAFDALRRWVRPGNETAAR